MSTRDFALIVLLVVVLILAFRVRLYMNDRAAKGMIELMAKNRAVGPENAMDLEQLGLPRKGFMYPMFPARNYRQDALMLLMRKKIVEVTEEGKFYLTQEAYQGYLATKSAEPPAPK